MNPSHRPDKETAIVQPPATPSGANGSAPEPWWVFRGTAELPEPPPWRRFPASRRLPRAQRHLMSDDEIAVVNAALHLRRPLLVTGRPGTGKSSLARAVAEDLGLGDVLRWSVNSRSTLAELPGVRTEPAADGEPEDEQDEGQQTGGPSCGAGHADSRAGVSRHGKSTSRRKNLND